MTCYYFFGSSRYPKTLIQTYSVFPNLVRSVLLFPSYTSSCIAMAIIAGKPWRCGGTALQLRAYAEEAKSQCRLCG